MVRSAVIFAISVSLIQDSDSPRPIVSNGNAINSDVTLIIVKTALSHGSSTVLVWISPLQVPPPHFLLPLLSFPLSHNAFAPSLLSSCFDNIHPAVYLLYPPIMPQDPSADEALARMGYKSELPRNLSMLSILGLYVTASQSHPSNSERQTNQMQTTVLSQSWPRPTVSVRPSTSP